MATDGERCGYLDVKVPAKSRGKGINAWKAWKKRWIVLQGMINVTTGRQLVTIDLYSHTQDRIDVGQQHQHRLQQRTTVCLEGVLSVRRTISKSHPYAFAVRSANDDDNEINDDDASIHLSGNSETESQTWIRTLRLILRHSGTSTPPPLLRASIGQVFEACLIECLSDHVYVGNGDKLLSGPVGYLVVLPSVLLLASQEDGCILAELLSNVVHRVLLIQNVHQTEDKNKIIIIEVSNGSTGRIKRLRFFSEKANEIVTNLTGWKTTTVTTSTIKFDDVSVIENNQTINDQQRSLRCRRNSSFSGRKLTLDYRFSRSDTDLCSVGLPTMNSIIELNSELDNLPKERCPSLTVSQSECEDHLTEDSFPVPNTATKPSLLKLECDQRPLSSYSSTSQVSTDSGVMMNNSPDEMSMNPVKLPIRRIPIPLRVKPRIEETEVEDGPMYRKFTDFLQAGDKSLYENLPDRISTSSDSETVYSEIDGASCHEDNLYEDLDKFRKNIHKLLGIPNDVVVLNTATKVSTPLKDDMASRSTVDLRRPPPPPLPPRRYKEPIGRRKDVMKYLGANSMTRSTMGEKKHKNIYRYLGIPTMALSQPIDVNRVDSEQMYDVPAQRSNTLMTRKYSRTFVRPVNSISNLSSSYTSTSGSTFTLPSTDTKQKKKRSMTFLRRKTSKDGSSIERKSRANVNSSTSSTYISYDIYKPEEWQEIERTLEINQIDSRKDINAEAPSLPIVEQPDKLVIQEELERNIETDTQEYCCIDEEHYCVPINRGSVDVGGLPELEQPLYMNLTQLQLNELTSEGSVYGDEDKMNGITSNSFENYLEMGTPFSVSLKETSKDCPRHQEENQNPLAILESVISCIDELRALCNGASESPENPDDQDPQSEEFESSRVNSDESLNFDEPNVVQPNTDDNILSEKIDVSEILAVCSVEEPQEVVMDNEIVDEIKTESPPSVNSSEPEKEVTKEID